MRQICIALCFSFFASVIHAAGMPIDIPAPQSQHHITATDSAIHHCDGVVSSAPDNDSKQPCHSDSYQCCLGFVLIPRLSAQGSITSTQAPFSSGSPLLLQPMVNGIYKPPKSLSEFSSRTDLNLWHLVTHLFLEKHNDNDPLHGVIGC